MKTSQESICCKNSSEKLSPRRRLLAGALSFGVIAFMAFVFWAGHHDFDFLRLSGPCGFKQQYQLPCPTCGMTTAWLELSRGHVLNAFNIQPAGAVLFIAALLIAAGTLYYAISGRQIRAIAELPLRYVVLALIVIIVAGWTVTLARTIAGWQ